MIPYSGLARVLTCPRCRQTVSFGDIFVAEPPHPVKITIGSASRVVLQPCGCTATSGEPEFANMLRVVEMISRPEPQTDATVPPVANP